MTVIYTFIFVSILFIILFLMDLLINNSEIQKENFVVSNITIYIIINQNSINNKTENYYKLFKKDLEIKYGVGNVFMIYYNSDDYKLLNISDKPMNEQGIIYIKKNDKYFIYKEQYIDLVYNRITLKQIIDKINSM